MQMKNSLLQRMLMMVLLGTFFTFVCLGQSKGQLSEYKRNALAEMLIYHTEDEFGYDIYQAFLAIPTPDKYDSHEIGLCVIKNDSIRTKNGYGLEKAEYGNSLSSRDVKNNAEAILNVLNEAECAKILVARWFNMFGNSVDQVTCNTELIQQRGQYNASDLDVTLARQTARGLATLSDAGEELLSHTFILVNDITYIMAEERAKSAKTALSVIGMIGDALLGTNVGSTIADAASDIADSFTGFTVKTHSYLYQLVWNDSVAAVFYDQYYTDTPNAEKIQAFVNDTSLFKLKYVAHEFQDDSKTTLKGKYDRNELVKMVCTRAIDKNIAALQLAYEDFKVKTPVYSVVTDQKGKTIGYAAKIGMKEGISETSSFQVVQRIVDPSTNRTKYCYVATVKPVKGSIWDNRYNAVTEQSAGATLSYTLFKKTSGGEILPGMLLVEGKYSKVKE